MSQIITDGMITWVGLKGSCCGFTFCNDRGHKASWRTRAKSVKQGAANKWWFCVGSRIHHRVAGKKVSCFLCDIWTGTTSHHYLDLVHIQVLERETQSMEQNYPNYFSDDYKGLIQSSLCFSTTEYTWLSSTMFLSGPFPLPNSTKKNYENHATFTIAWNNREMRVFCIYFSACHMVISEDS